MSDSVIRNADVQRPTQAYTGRNGRPDIDVKLCTEQKSERKQTKKVRKKLENKARSQAFRSQVGKSEAGAAVSIGYGRRHEGVED